MYHDHLCDQLALQLTEFGKLTSKWGKRSAPRYLDIVNLSVTLPPTVLSVVLKLKQLAEELTTECVLLNLDGTPRRDVMHRINRVCHKAGVSIKFHPTNPAEISHSWSDVRVRVKHLIINLLVESI